MEVKISEEYDTSSVICLELDDDHQLSLEYLCSCFPGATGLKFKNLTTGNWTGLVCILFFLLLSDIERRACQCNGK